MYEEELLDITSGTLAIPTNVFRQSLIKSRKFSVQIAIKTHLLFCGLDCYLLAKLPSQT